MLRLTFFRPIIGAPVIIPLLSARISAGFPSPAADYEDEGIDLQKHLMPRPASTFIIKVEGNSMMGAGIIDGDMIVVDRSVRPREGSIVVARIGDGFTVKRFTRKRGNVWLMPENDAYPAYEIEDGESDCEIWGCVTGSFRKYRR